MFPTYLIAGLLLAGAVIVWFRPQWISTLNGLPPEKLKNVNLRKVSRIASGGLALMAMIVGGGSWLLLQAGVSEQVTGILGMIAVFIGGIIITGLVEMQNHNK